MAFSLAKTIEGSDLPRAFREPLLVHGNALIATIRAVFVARGMGDPRTSPVDEGGDRQRTSTPFRRFQHREGHDPDAIRSRSAAQRRSAVPERRPLSSNAALAFELWSLARARRPAPKSTHWVCARSA